MLHAKTNMRAILGASTSMAVILAAGSAWSQEEPIFLGTVILSGERTDRPLTDTFAGVSVLRTEQIDRNSDGPLNDLVVQTPNVFVESPNETPSIRGIQGGGPGGAVSTAITGAPPRLAFVTDGVTRPTSIANSSGVSLWDVKQVEVFRGPQSLLRGRSAIAGAIIVKTKDPTFEREGAVQFGVEIDDDSDPNFVLNGVVSGPVSDNTAVRLSFEFADGDDWRTTSGLGAGDYVTEYDNVRVRAKVLSELDTSLGSLTLKFTGEHQSGQTPQTRATVSTPGVNTPPVDRVLLNPGTNTRTFDTETNLVSFEATLDTGAGQWTSITSFIDDSYQSVPEQVFPSPIDVNEEIFAQELTFTFGETDRVRAGQFGGLIGFSYEKRDQNNAVGLPTPIGGAINFTSQVETESTSLYADLRYGLTDNITIFGGARLLRFEDTRTQTSVAPVPLPSATQNTSQSETEFLPALGIAYYFDDDTVISASVRTGYNPGGGAINLFTGLPYSFESEEVTTAELTFRKSAPDDSYSFGLNLFYNWHDNPQLFAELVPGDRRTLQVINQPEGESYGLEIEGTWKPNDTLTLNVSLGLLETEITQASATRAALLGNSFGQDPKVTIAFGAEYAVTDNITINGRATYRGESFNDFNNTAGSQVGDYWLVDIGATANFGNLQARFYVNNLFDEIGVNRYVGSFAEITPPRTVGLMVTHKF